MHLTISKAGCLLWRKSVILWMLLLYSICFSTGVSSHGEHHRPDNPQKYLILTDGNYPPFSQLDNKKLHGIDISIFKTIAKKHSIQHQFITLDFKTIFSTLLERKADAAIAAITITDERKQMLDFSLPYYETETIFATKKKNAFESLKQIKSFKNKIFGVQKGTTSATIAQTIKRTYPSMKIVYFNDIQTMFDGLLNGNIFALIEDFAAAAYTIKNNKRNKMYQDIKLIKTNYPKSYYGLAVLKGTNDILLEKFNLELNKMIRNGMHTKLIQQHLQ